MKYLLLSIFWCVCFAKKENGVLELTDQDWQRYYETHKRMLVFFYLPMCGYCIDLKPEFEAAAQELAEIDTKYVLAKYNAATQSKLSQKLQLRGYPTLIYFLDGIKVDYTGDYTKASIVEWIQQKDQLPSKEISCQEIKEKADNELIEYFVTYFGDLNSEVFTKAHVPSAYQRFDIHFFHNNNPDCAKEFNLTLEEPRFLFFRNFEPKVFWLHKETKTSEILMKAILRLELPVLFELDQKFIHNTLFDKRNILVMFRKEEDKDALFMKIFEYAAYNQSVELRDLSKNIYKYDRSFLYAYCDIKSIFQEKLAQVMKITEEMMPVLAVIKSNEETIIHPVSPLKLTSEDIWKFERDIKNDGWKSQDPIQQTGLLVPVVGSNFDKIVRDPSRDILLLATTSQCYLCEQAQEIITRLAEEFQYVKDFSFATYDAQENLTPGFWVDQVPEIVLFTQDDKSGKIYKGEFNFKSIKQMILGNSKILKQKYDENKDNSLLGYIKSFSDEL